MPPASYRKPPITEAIIAFHFNEALDERALERFRIKRKRAFPRVEEMRNVTVELGTRLAIEQKTNGHKLSSADGLTVALMLPTQLSTSRLAPYKDWDGLMSLARENFEALVSVAGSPRPKTLSARYLNRIDIPVRPNEPAIDVSRYFRLQVIIPEGKFCNSTPNFFLQTILYSLDQKFQFNIRFGSAIPVLIDHASFILDIDTSTVGELSARKEGVWEMLNELRRQKNECFESCITDAARKLFQ